MSFFFLTAYLSYNIAIIFILQRFSQSRYLMYFFPCFCFSGWSLQRSIPHHPPTDKTVRIHLFFHSQRICFKRLQASFSYMQPSRLFLGSDGLQYGWGEALSYNDLDDLDNQAGQDSKSALVDQNDYHNLIICKALVSG